LGIYIKDYEKNMEMPLFKEAIEKNRIFRYSKSKQLNMNLVDYSLMRPIIKPVLWYIQRKL